LIRGLVQKGWRVSLFSLDPFGNTDEHWRRELDSLCDWTAVESFATSRPRRSVRLLRDAVFQRPFQLDYFFDRRAADRLRAHLRTTSYDIVQVCQLYMVRYLPQTPACPLVFDSVNAEARRLAVLAGAAPFTGRGLVARAQLGTVRRLEQNIARAASLVLAVSDEEVGYFQAIPDARVVLVPNGVDVAVWPQPLPLTSEPGILLMGSLNYSANVDAVMFFLEKILDHLAHPAARITVLGIDPPATLFNRARRAPRPVQITGFVESTRPYLEEARVLAVPLRYGGGTRLKILEALGAGIPVVSTTIGCEGLGLVHEREILIADDPREFAGCLDRLLVDDDLCARLALAGRKVVERRFDWRTIAAQRAFRLDAPSRLNTAREALTGVLLTADELLSARKRALAAGLCPLPDQRKYWDNWRAIQALQARIGGSEPIVDLGCRSGILLTWLDQLGYQRLYGCDVRYPLPPLKAALRQGLWSTVYAGVRMAVRHRAGMRRASVERTGFPSGHFAAATCMSVVEHGVDLPEFFAECARILRPRGVLALSTDYWPERIDLRGMRRFAGPDRIFDHAGALALCEAAEHNGLHVAGEPQLDTVEAVIESDGFRFTFLYILFERA
jgi:glycosyltransferase involved in cell wall biosynthesis/SAM-dependent methyltransferase